MTTNVGSTDYHGLQLELRRRYAQGLQFQINYAYGQTMHEQFPVVPPADRHASRRGRAGRPDARDQVTVVYDLPFGQGRRFGSGANGVVERIIGGWTVGLSSRMQSGQLVNLGNVRLVGMTADDVQDMYKLRFDDANKFIYMLPQPVIDETIKAFSVSATSATGYGTLGAPSGRYFAPANGPDCIEVANNVGECGSGDLVVAGPMFQQHDISLAKRVRHRRPHRVRVPRRDAERVQPRELRAGRRARQRDRQLPRHRPDGHQHGARRSAGGQVQLVTRNAEC